MNTRPGSILVAGATGNQGGATLRHLRGQGWKVRALTRYPDSERARALLDLGVEVVRGNYDDRMSLDRALEGVYGVFLPSLQQNLRVSPKKETEYGMPSSSTTWRVLRGR